MANTRKQERLEGFWALGLTTAQRTAIEGILMDMSAPYVQATRAQIPDADTKIVFDRFHYAKHLNKGVDRVRRAEHRELQAAGDTRLTGTKYARLRHPDHFTRKAWRAFTALRTSTLKVARAWALKEATANLWEYRYVGAACSFFQLVLLGDTLKVEADDQLQRIAVMGASSRSEPMPRGAGCVVWRTCGQPTLGAAASRIFAT